MASRPWVVRRQSPEFARECGAFLAEPQRFRRSLPSGRARAGTCETSAASTPLSRAPLGLFLVVSWLVSRRSCAASVDGWSFIDRPLAVIPLVFLDRRAQSLERTEDCHLRSRRDRSPKGRDAPLAARLARARPSPRLTRGSAQPFPNSTLGQLRTRLGTDLLDRRLARSGRTLVLSDLARGISLDLALRGQCRTGIEHALRLRWLDQHRP